jgi:uncharacterized membrane protein
MRRESSIQGELGAGGPGSLESRRARRPGRARRRRRSASPGLWFGLAGAALLVYGLRRRDAVGAGIGTLGAGLIAGGVTKRGLRSRGARSRRGIESRRSFRVGVPRERVFDFWTQVGNFPQFMSNVREVHDMGFGRSHWVVTGPGGVPVEWDAVVTVVRPHERIEWTTVPGSAIEHSGIVRFRPDPAGGTRVDVVLSYRPPAGAAGHVIAQLFRVDPQTQLDEDMDRLKAILEQRMQGREPFGLAAESVPAP